MMASAADLMHLELPCHLGITNQGRDADKAASSLMSVKGSGGKRESLEASSGLLGAWTIVFSNDAVFYPCSSCRKGGQEGVDLNCH